MASRPGECVDNGPLIADIDFTRFRMRVSTDRYLSPEHHAREREWRFTITTRRQRPAIRTRDVTADAPLVTLRGVQQAQRKPEVAKQHVARDR